MRSTTRIRSPSQSGYKVEKDNRNPWLNPYVCVKPFDPVQVEGFGDIVETLNDVNTAYISRLSRENSGESTHANTEKADSCRSVYSSSRDVTASRSTQGVASRQAEQADCDYEKMENDGYLKDFNSNYTSEAVDKSCGDTADRTEFFSKETNVEILFSLCSSLIPYSNR